MDISLYQIVMSRSRNSIPDRSGIFSSLPIQERHWNQPRLLHIGSENSLSCCQVGVTVKLIVTYFCSQNSKYKGSKIFAKTFQVFSYKNVHDL